MGNIPEKSLPTERMVSLLAQNREKLHQGSAPLLNQLRDGATERFAQLGIPDRKDENYKYTDLASVYDKNYNLSLSREQDIIDLNEVFKCNVPQLDTHLVFLVNGWFYSGNNPSSQLPKGVILCGLEQIANEQPELFEKYYNRQVGLSNDPFVALNTAFAKDGFFLYIPQGVVIEKPIQIINLLRSDERLMVTQRNLVISETSAQVKLLVCDHTLTLSPFLYNSVTEVFLAERSVVDLYAIQNQHNQSSSIQSTFFCQQHNTMLSAGILSLHAGLVRNNLNVAFNGSHSEANIFGISLTDKTQHVDTFVQVNHNQPQCTSNQLFKNILNDESTGAFTGLIHVARNAQQTNAFQRNNNVLLSDKAKMQTKPQLIIDADDVKCSHGATIGQIDANALFFLRSRGIGEAEARVMLMNAFAQEVVQKVSIPPLRDRINELIDKRMRNELSICHDCRYQCDK